jgi:hypothetical protein
MLRCISPEWPKAAVPECLLSAPLLGLSRRRPEGTCYLFGCMEVASCRPPPAIGFQNGQFASASWLYIWRGNVMTLLLSPLT